VQRNVGKDRVSESSAPASSDSLSERRLVGRHP
jgi:hypothetical protein